MFKKIKISDFNWRFHLFSRDESYFIYDSFLHKIFSVSKDLFSFLYEEDFSSIRRKYPKFFSSVIRQNTPRLRNIDSSKECYVTIDYSNKCNLNCNYCYRDKKEETELSFNDLKDILIYITQKYQKKAEHYIFSLGYTSESSVSYEKIKYFDYLAAFYEGFLFDSKTSKRIAKRYFNSLPIEIKQKYEHVKKNNLIGVLNGILKNEELWTYGISIENDYVIRSLNRTKILSFSKRVKFNRIILDELIGEKKLSRKRKTITISFMTNGTNLSDDYVLFVKSLLLEDFSVSIDGPKEIHDINRKYRNGKGSFSETLNGINKLQNSGIEVTASVVITPTCLDIEKLISFFLSHGIKRISFNLQRGSNGKSAFSKKDIDILIMSFMKLIDKIYSNFEKGNIINEFLCIKETIIFAPMKLLFTGKRLLSRCTWGKVLVIDSKGRLYHCDSCIGDKRDCLGHFRDNKKKHQLLCLPDVRENIECNKCYAKYLCGGTCYFEKLNENTENQQIECYFHKRIIDLNLDLYVRLKSRGLLINFMKVLIK